MCKKILLVFPPTISSMESPRYVCPPLGIAYLASMLRNEYEIELLDATVEGYNNEVILSDGRVRFGLTCEAIERRIEQFSPDFLGVSCLYSSQFPLVIETCSLAKKSNPQTVTITGGTHPTFLFSKCLENQVLDFIVLGEGEYIFKELIHCISKGKDFSEIGGLAYKKENKIFANPKSNYISNLDLIPYPSRDLLPMEKYFAIDLPMGVTSKKKPSTSLITSRGCPYSCIFCSSSVFWGHKYRTRSPENIMGEIKGLINDFGVKELKFHDDNLTLDNKRANSLFKKIIDNKFDISWTAPNGLSVWTLDDKMLGLMKASGCYEVTLAIESGNKKVLEDIIKKPLDLNSVFETIKKIKYNKMYTSAFFIIGFPGETKKQINETLSFAEKIKVDRVSIMIANPLPGTRMYEICKREGHVADDFNFEKNDYNKAVIINSDLSRKEIEGMRNRWFLIYNLKCFIKNPVSFFKRYGKFIFKNPSAVLDILHLKKIRVNVKKFT